MNSRDRDVAERVTVNLTSRASQALREITELTGDNETDSINRALSVYAYIERVTRNGEIILIKGEGDTDLRQLVIF